MAALPNADLIAGAGPLPVGPAKQPASSVADRIRLPTNLPFSTSHEIRSPISIGNSDRTSAGNVTCHFDVTFELAPLMLQLYSPASPYAVDISLPSCIRFTF
jgi:hypothetical protein